MKAKEQKQSKELRIKKATNNLARGTAAAIFVITSADGIRLRLETLKVSEKATFIVVALIVLGLVYIISTKVED